MRKIGFITGLEKEAIILRKIDHYTNSEIIWVGNKQGSAYTQANTLVKNGCEILISFGFAGALDPELSAGDLVIPKSVTDAECNTFSTDYNLYQKISRHFSNKFKVSGGTLFGSETIIWDADEKRRLFNKYNTEHLSIKGYCYISLEEHYEYNQYFSLSNFKDRLVFHKSYSHTQSR